MRKFRITERVEYELEVEDEVLEGYEEDVEAEVDAIFCDSAASSLLRAVVGRDIEEITEGKRQATCGYCGQPLTWGHFCQEFVQAESRRVAEQRIREADES